LLQNNLLEIGQLAAAVTVRSGSSTCRTAWRCEENTWRTMPSLSITNLTRPGKIPSVALTPYKRRDRSATVRDEDERQFVMLGEVLVRCHRIPAHPHDLGAGIDEDVKG
jgi:hypothetical protein